MVKLKLKLNLAKAEAKASSLGLAELAITRVVAKYCKQTGDQPIDTMIPTLFLFFKLWDICEKQG